MKRINNRKFNYEAAWNALRDNYIFEVETSDEEGNKDGMAHISDVQMLMNDLIYDFVE